MVFHRALLFFLVIVFAESLRIPENPCPAVFQYYKKSGNGEVYGEAVIPYDGNHRLEFSVNASLVGYFKKADLKIQLATPLKQIINGPTIKYNIFFPFSNVIPKITQITYNRIVYCSGPPEPLIPGTAGITNVWSNHIYSFSTVLSTKETENTDNTVGSGSAEDSGISDTDIPVKDPNIDSNLASDVRQKFDENPFLNSEVNSGFVSVTKSPKIEQCGIANNLILPLIIGGTETQEGQYPWLAALFAYNSKKNIYEYRCTANLISDRHVITAARCVQYYRVQTVKNADILIILGKNDLTHWATNGATTRGATRVQSHPYFQENSKSAHGDIAVITLDKPVAFSNSIRPICLWDETDDLDPLVNQKGTLAAWGADEASQKSGELSVLLAKHIELPIVSQFDCLKSDVIYRNFTSEMTFCAGEKNGKGPCIGDSGAGFAVPKDRIFYLRGIVSIASSNSDGSCDLNKYVIFCDVAKFGSWVKSCMKN